MEPRRGCRPKRALGLMIVLAGLALTTPVGLFAREKKQAVSPSDPTYRLFNLLDTSYGGKLADFYLFGGVYTDPSHPGQELQHILRVQYDKKLFFGKFRIYVRSVAKPTEAQLKAYTVKEFYDFASDSEKFEKIDAGPFGQKGDMYFVATDDTPLTSAPITPEAQTEYDKLLTEYLIPALEKNKPTG
jgi:hypothetical protein